MATALMAAKEGNYRVASFESQGSVTLGKRGLYWLGGVKSLGYASNAVIAGWVAAKRDWPPRMLAACCAIRGPVALKRAFAFSSTLRPSFHVRFTSYFLGAMVELRKATVNFVMSVRPHGTARLPPDGFSWSLKDLSKICRENSSFIIIWQS